MNNGRVYCLAALLALSTVIGFTGCMKGFTATGPSAVPPASTPAGSPASGSPTVTFTSTPTPTGTWYTPTFTITPTKTFTNCMTFTPTVTFSPVPPTATPVNWITGTVNYTGAGSVDTDHYLVVGLLAPPDQLFAGTVITTNGGTYNLGTAGPGTYSISAYYVFNGCISDPNSPFGAVCSSTGNRYASTGACSSPVTFLSYSVTVIGSAGTTTTGPSITIDGTCGFSGIYGAVNYTGSKGMVNSCRTIQVQTFTDAAYSSPAPYSSTYTTKSGVYDFVTNTGNSPTGLTPLYILAWFDANGDGVFDTGDPYIQIGPVTPTTDGVLQDIVFGDAYVK